MVSKKATDTVLMVVLILSTALSIIAAASLSNCLVVLKTSLLALSNAVAVVLTASCPIFSTLVICVSTLATSLSTAFAIDVNPVVVARSWPICLSILPLYWKFYLVIYLSLLYRNRSKEIERSEISFMDWLFGKKEEKEKPGKVLDEHKKLCEEVRREFFNCMIFGKTKSGKTYFLLNILYPMIRDQYKYVYVFSRKTNEEEYKKAIPKCIFVDDNHLEVLQLLMHIQQNNNIDQNATKKEGKTRYKDNILVIWDDFLDAKTFREDSFKSQFFNGRHYQFSIIVLTQVTNRIISTDIRGNTQFNVFFKIVDTIQSRMCTDRINEALVNMGVDEKEVKSVCNKIKRECINNKPHGFVVINDSSDFLYPDIESMLRKEKEPILDSSSDEEDAS